MFYLETGYGESEDNPSIETIEKRLAELPEMDDEHGAFWVVDKHENVIEIHKDFTVLFHFTNRAQDHKGSVSNFGHALAVFTDFLRGHVNKIRKDFLPPLDESCPHEMLIESKGMQFGKFHIPPFTLRKGEIVVINLGNGAHNFELTKDVVSVLEGNMKQDGTQVLQPLTFVNHFRQSRFRRLFSSTSVGQYIRKNADTSNQYTEKIYEIPYITAKTKVNSLAGTPRKLLALYTTLSRTKNITFDLAGLDPAGAAEIYTRVNRVAANGGAAILLDWTDGMKDNCTSYLQLKHEKN
jgi:hypothetical protein